LSSLDATVAAYAQLIQHLRLPNRELCDALAKYPRLVEHADRVFQTLGVHTSREPESDYFDVDRARERKQVGRTLSLTLSISKYIDSICEFVSRLCI
jgi:hypothetical protein